MANLLSYIFILAGLILLINPLYFAYKILEKQYNNLIQLKDMIDPLISFTGISIVLIFLSVLGIGLIMIGIVGSLNINTKD